MPGVQETPVGSLGQEDPLKKERANHSSILVQKNRMERSLVGVHGVTESQTLLSNFHFHSIFLIAAVIGATSKMGKGIPLHFVNFVVPKHSNISSH